MSIPEGKEIILKGSGKTGIFDTIHWGSKGLVPQDPFADFA